ncbi:hypothetical protein Pint_00239 [Pistacia integerrima]|uniref:Uncharacterized protein n=1 Tax=Pistacia integerrima TaxID=434235 RepID=A0ACC0ZNM5_9ROSI|nr:hypothetical protein Pint_00239 [Pistacia integerrima]
MQREREGRNGLFDMGDPFATFQGFGGFGSHRSMMPSLFGGRDPFDDTFFTRPFGFSEPSMFGQRTSSRNTPQTNEAKGIVIEELNSDEEGEKEEDIGSGDEKDNHKIRSGSSKEPFVEHPDDVDTDERKSKSVNHINHHNKVEGTQSQAHSSSFQTCRVTYGGVDGAYYTSTRTRRAGNDGMVLEESKEADTTTGQATHRISKGIHDKVGAVTKSCTVSPASTALGHSVTRKLNADGKVDAVQTLHNLNEDELAGFEESWRGNAKPGWNDGFNRHHNAGSSSDDQSGKATWGGWMLPSTRGARSAGKMMANKEASSTTSAGRTKKVVRINIE